MNFSPKPERPLCSGFPDAECKENLSAYSHLLCEESLNDLPGDIEMKDTNGQWHLISDKYVPSLLRKEEASSNSAVNFSNHPDLNPLDRSDMLDLLSRSANHFKLSRATFYLACKYVDLVLANKCNIGKEELFCLGVSSLALSMKMTEGHVLSIHELCKYFYRETRPIKRYERDMLRIMRFKIVHITAYDWVEYLMAEWDNFIATKFMVFYDDDFMSENLICFRRQNAHDFKRHYQTYQLLDALHLDHNINMFKQGKIALALLYFLTVKFFFETEFKILKGQDSNSSLYVMELFNEFILGVVEIYDLNDLEEEIRFIVQYQHLHLGVTIFWNSPFFSFDYVRFI